MPSPARPKRSVSALLALCGRTIERLGVGYECTGQSIIRGRKAAVLTAGHRLQRCRPLAHHAAESFDCLGGQSAFASRAAVPPRAVGGGAGAFTHLRRSLRRMAESTEK